MQSKFIYNIKIFVIRFIKDDVMALSSQLAYSLVFSFFPFLIFIISLVGYIPVEGSDILLMLNGILPEDILRLIESTVVSIVNTRNNKILFLSLIFTIWSASNGFQAVIKGLNKAYDKDEDRGMLKLYTVSIMCTFGIIFIILITSILLVFGQLLGQFLIIELGLNGNFNFAWNVIRYLIIIFSISAIFGAVYIYTPNVRLKWYEVIPGSIVSTVGLVLISMCFAFYVNNFANYSLIYGSIGAAIVLLTWLFILSNITIIGGEINAIFWNKRRFVNK